LSTTLWWAKRLLGEHMLLGRFALFSGTSISNVSYLSFFPTPQTPISTLEYILTNKYHLSYLFCIDTNPSYNSNGDYTPVVVFFSFIIGLTCSLTMTSAIEAGVSTIFVGLGEDPQVLAIRAPELFALIAQTYPRVVRGVNDE